MRAEFAQAMLALADERENLVFLTGDLGYMALEKVAERYGERFVNTGVAEQNMVSVAAGLAHEGFLPWVYSIAPFAVLRPYEQIRNDVCLHNLPVKIVGNGGGYGYGIMGATHHVLEDIAVMRVLPNMRVYVPLLASDVGEAVRAMAADPAPNYLRLNLGMKSRVSTGPFSQWRKVKDGSGVVVIGTGPVIDNLFEAADTALLDALEIWSIGILPVEDLPAELSASVDAKGKVVTVEEHYGQCGLNEAVAALLLREPRQRLLFRSAVARGYPSRSYGSQRWHQEESGLAGDTLFALLRSVVHA